MAMTLRLSPADDATLARLAVSFRTSKNSAAAAAIDLAASRPDHAEFVKSSTLRLLDQYSRLMGRLAEV